MLEHLLLGVGETLEENYRKLWLINNPNHMVITSNYDIKA